LGAGAGESPELGAGALGSRVTGVIGGKNVGRGVDVGGGNGAGCTIVTCGNVHVPVGMLGIVGGGGAAAMGTGM